MDDPTAVNVTQRSQQLELEDLNEGGGEVVSKAWLEHLEVDLH